MTPHYSDEWLTVYLGDCRDAMASMEAESVQTVVCSPPYFGLRDYGLPPAVWGDHSDPLTHVHDWLEERRPAQSGGTGRSTLGTASGGHGISPEGIERSQRRQAHGGALTAQCGCGAWLGTIGLEPTLALYIEHMVEVFRAVRRVLRPDGTVWLNLGDSYASSLGKHSPDDKVVSKQLTNTGSMAGLGRRSNVVPGLKPKDRMGMPHRVVFALQDDGWWWRDEIIWHKNNPMPSSVADRTTPAHEMMFTLSKRARYYYDADAIREPSIGTTEHDLTGMDTKETLVPGQTYKQHRLGREKVPGGWDIELGSQATVHRNGRTSATYRDKTLVDPNARGARQAPEPGEPNAFHPLGRNKRSVWTIATQPYAEAHFATFPEKLVEPCILAGAPLGGVVLDPFGGSGTVAMVANRLGRRAVHIDLSPEYTEQAIKRIATSRARGEGPAVDMPVSFAEDGLWAEAVS